ncbi:MULTISPECIES: stage III sporulation protein AF [Bacillaceae]|uniref:stage III sporulation protein AF n=1 Tax=Bacillaceae TaxID=186817 RepID=UPI000E2F4F47|nr:stage III sporulation protein AF [Bacillus sp. HNG]RFB09463.1 stage III sporulation protein AF [Bacillus sp. HNG]
MELITNWIQQLILIILFAYVVEMLLPSSQWNKYVKTVLSVIILLVLLQPVLTIFKVDINNLFSKTNISKESDFLYNEKTNEYSNKINQIQNDMISQQVTDLMKKKVTDELASEYKLAINNIAISGKDGEMNVSVTLVDIVEEEVQSIESSKPVSINLIEIDKNRVAEEDIGLRENEGVLALLSQSWDLQKKDIKLIYRTSY